PNDRSRIELASLVGDDCLSLGPRSRTMCSAACLCTQPFREILLNACLNDVPAAFRNEASVNPFARRASRCRSSRSAAERRSAPLNARRPASVSTYLSSRRLGWVGGSTNLTHWPQGAR